MAVIDLKNVDIFIEDGTVMEGAAVGNHTTGCTTITVNGFVGEIVPVGARVTIDDYEYQATTVGTIGGNTANLGLSPALQANLSNATVIDVAGVFLRVKVGDGTVTWSEKKPREYKLNRGRIDSVRDADEVPMDVAINIMYEELTASSGATAPTPEDALKQRGLAADWVSTDTSDPCAPYAVNIRLDHLPPTCTSFEKERVILPYFRYEEIQHDPKAGTLVCNGKCNATQAIVSRIPTP